MAPIDHPLNMLTQSILVYASYALFLAALLVALKMGIKQKTPFFILLILAAAVGGYAEPLYDEAFDLWFYAPGQWTAYTSFGIPQPYWVYSGYAILYGVTGVITCNLLMKGRLTRNGLFALAGMDLVISIVFEVFGINGIGGGAYEYWGPHTLRIFNYPLAIGVLEAAQVTCFSVFAFELFRRSNGKPLALLGLFVLFPMTFYGVNFGAGAPLIVALHLDDPSYVTMLVATLISMSLAVCAVFGVSKLLPATAK
jgi:hypothetical protein